MAKYNVPFININTFIYEPSYGDKPTKALSDVWKTAIELVGAAVLYPDHDTSEIVFSEKIDKLDGSGNFTIRLQQNTLGILGNYFSNQGSVEYYANTKFFESQGRLPTTASFLTALNLKRNGPYGFPTWKQIRIHENPLTRNQKKKNIITIVPDTKNITSYNQVPNQVNKYIDSTGIEVYKENVFNSTGKLLSINYVKGTSVYKSTLEMGSAIRYFDNTRLNNLYAPYDFSDQLQTDTRFKSRFLNRVGSMVGNFNNILSYEFNSHIYPKVHLMYENRTRNNFYFPWKDKLSERYDKEIPYPIGNLALVPVGRVTPNTQTTSLASFWPLDIHSNYNSLTSRNPFGGKFNDETNSGVLQHSMMYGRELTLGNIKLHLDSNDVQVHPLYAHKQTTTPLTSVCSAHGMEIEGVNSGSTFGNLDRDHILSGEAFWDAPAQYGKNPFYNTYTDFVDDIKRVGKEMSVIPEFRSSFNFNDLQNSPQRTPKTFLEITGGQAAVINVNNTGYVVSSSANKEFYDVYSHSDFLTNFDVVQEASSLSSRPLFKMSLKCKAIKKLVPYDGFYPAQRTVQIANKFMEAIYPNTSYVSTALGELSASSEIAAPYFNNIMTPMFAPGILYNSIKSGLAVDYPIHTSSLTLANGGVKLFNSNHYIQKPFDERIPFEALIEPADYLSGREIHCSNPHPSGNFSGSATWGGAGDTGEYQLMMHNFLAETANFFLQDQNFSFIASKKSSDTNINLVSGSTYSFQVKLYKSQNITSDKYTLVGETLPSLIMTGSEVRETFTMYSRPSAFGPPSRVTGSQSTSHFTGSASDLGQNYPFTPAYYDGAAISYYLYKATRTGRHTVQEVFNSSSVQQVRHTSEKIAGTIEEQLRFAHLNDISPVPSSYLKDSCMHVNSSINTNIGYVKDIDLLDDDNSNTVKVAVDISSDQDAQIIVQPKWETPMLNFQSYKNSSTVTLPLIGSQSVPRGMWHQYGQIETNPAKGVFLQVSDLDPATAGGTLPMADKLGFPTTPVKLGRTASKKVIREAIVAVPFYEYNTGARYPEEERKFFRLSRQEVNDALSGNGKESVIDMVEKMQRFVMPPIFNFLKDTEINPMPMYIFEFKHVLDQEDLAAIWQNLPPKIMTEFEAKSLDTNAEEKTISHTFESGELLSLLNLQNEGSTNDVLQNLRWMVFKVKQKASDNYYEKVIGEKKELNTISPYSHNWPYDYFSLVELAKIDAGVIYADTPPDIPIEGPDINSITIPEIGSVTLPSTAQPVPKTSTKRRQMIGKETVSKTKLNNKASTSAPSKNPPVSPGKKPTPSLPKTNPVTGNKAKAISKPPKTRENSSKSSKIKGINNIIPEKKTGTKQEKKTQGKTYTRSVSRGKKK